MYLELQGFTVFGAQSGEEALEVMCDRLPDLVVLDGMLPGLNGFETLQELRRVSNVPVIMLTSLVHEDQRVQGLTLGADDYLAKPFSQNELAARIQALLRRAEQPAHVRKTRIEPDEELAIDFDRGEVWHRGTLVHLTATEYRLLYHLASNPGRLMPAEVLLAKVWGTTIATKATTSDCTRRTFARSSSRIRPTRATSSPCRASATSSSTTVARQRRLGSMPTSEPSVYVQSAEVDCFSPAQWTN
jgi:DNA-binding response OmpR family regulator